MKYIRTQEGNIYKRLFIDRAIVSGSHGGTCDKDLNPVGETIIKEAETIEELCDELVIKYKNEEKPRCVDMNELLKTYKNIGISFRKHIEWLFDNYKDQLEICNLAIWTNEGLIYKAKVKGILPNGKIDWELL